MKFGYFILLALFPLYIYAAPSEEIRKKCAAQMNSAFQLQSMGQTTLALYAFRDAYKLAISNGESDSKLAAIEKLFGWYRTYGYSCGVLAEPSGITTECTYRNGMECSNSDPHKEKTRRDFLSGVTHIVSGVFCIGVHPPIPEKFGTGLVMTGFKYMYDSVSSVVKDDQEKKQRLTELNDLEQKFNETLNYD